MAVKSKKAVKKKTIPASKQGSIKKSSPSTKGLVKKNKKKGLERVPSGRSPAQSGKIQRVDIPKFLKEFDAELEKKRFKNAQKMLDTLRGIKKWQYLNLQSLINYKMGEVNSAEDQMRQALREPDCNVVVNRNLGGLLISQGRMREGLPFCFETKDQI